MSETERQKNIGTRFPVRRRLPEQGRKCRSRPRNIYQASMQNSWTLWFFKTTLARTGRIIKSPTTPHSRRFWALYNHIEIGLQVDVRPRLQSVQGGIKPMWEDERNSRGGRWVNQLEKKFRQSCLDNYWLEVMLCLIGEAFDDNSKSGMEPSCQWGRKEINRNLDGANETSRPSLASVKDHKERLKSTPRRQSVSRLITNTKTKSGHSQEPVCRLTNQPWSASA